MAGSTGEVDFTAGVESMTSMFFFDCNVAPCSEELADPSALIGSLRGFVSTFVELSFVSVLARNCGIEAFGSGVVDGVAAGFVAVAMTTEENG